MFGTGLQAGQVHGAVPRQAAIKIATCTSRVPNHRNEIALAGDERAVPWPVIHLGLDVICCTKRGGWDHSLVVPFVFVVLVERSQVKQSPKGLEIDLKEWIRITSHAGEDLLVLCTNVRKASILQTRTQWGQEEVDELLDSEGGGEAGMGSLVDYKACQGSHRKTPVHASGVARRGTRVGRNRSRLPARPVVCVGCEEYDRTGGCAIRGDAPRRPLGGCIANVIVAFNATFFFAMVWRSFLPEIGGFFSFFMYCVSKPSLDLREKS